MGSVFLIACAPRLYTPGGGDVLEWQAPENQWQVCDEPPADLAEADIGWDAGQTAPDARLLDQHGDEVSLWQFYGCGTLIDLSAIWCGPCQVAATEVDHIWFKHQDEGFMYLTFLSEDEGGDVPDREELEEWATDFGVTAPILADDEGHSALIANGGFPRWVALDRDLKVLDNNALPTEDVIEEILR